MVVGVCLYRPRKHVEEMTFIDVSANASLYTKYGMTQGQSQELSNMTISPFRSLEPG